MSLLKLDISRYINYKHAERLTVGLSQIIVNFSRVKTYMQLLRPFFFVNVLLFSLVVHMGIPRGPFPFLQSVWALVLQGQPANEASRRVELEESCSEG